LRTVVVLACPIPITQVPGYVCGRHAGQRGNPYDVAKMLGDTIETVEKHYMPFVKELWERVRNILELVLASKHWLKRILMPFKSPRKKPN
jgi:hypothetical protein